MFILTLCIALSAKNRSEQEISLKEAVIPEEQW